ncbi:MAG: hypothetical protein NC914_01380, partial [Candidatus Omnitrophica bacterium]|nr:hypothetical protein [Candidatus Omnitrophota bacterium]
RQQGNMRKYDGGLWWLQVYDEQRSLLYDQLFASNMFTSDDNSKEVRKDVTIMWQILYPKGLRLGN